MTERDAPLLEVDDLAIAFRGVKALDGVSFSVSPGGITAVIGPNGAGKTTLFNCITGLYRPDGGIRLDGRPIEGLPAAERIRLGIARTFQTPTLVEETTALENVMLGAHARTAAGLWQSVLALRGVQREDDQVRDEALEILAALHARALAPRQITGLPHRDRRIVEIARALLARPRILLLDEPAAGATPAEAHQMLADVSTLAASRGTTVVLVEHNVPLVLGVARSIVVLDFGRCIAHGSPDEIRSDARVIDAYLGVAA